MELKKQKEIYLYLLFSFLFATTVQQFPFFKGNSLHLLHAIKDFEFNNLQNDWIANQTDHLPLFTFVNKLFLKIFPINFLHIIHFSLLLFCSFFLFLICKNIFPNLNKIFQSILWFSIFIFVYHEHSLFGGLAGQDIINEGYQPASYGVLFFIGIYLFLIKKNFYATLFICLSASFHPSYVLHSGFLMIGILSYFFFQKEYKKLFKILISYSIFILPITLYIIYNFLLLDKEIITEGQNILLKRIPHHALIDNWFSYKDILSILVYVVSLFLIHNNKRAFIPLFFFGFFSIFITLIQFFTEINSLALIFPWRASVFLVPLSTMIIISFFLQKIDIQKSKFNLFSIFIFIILWIFFFVDNHFIKNSNKVFYDKLKLTQEITKNYNSIERILIPVDLTYIRMNTGLPIFIDWKHHAFKYNEIIHWQKRMNLAKNFYASNNLEKQKSILVDINKIETITHILINKEKLNHNCDDLINHGEYSLVSVINCYEIN
tara:strand:- start:8592 stop:10061 length:1470 start_codon:yes stop_codon:yes gene_type:complete